MSKKNSDKPSGNQNSKKPVTTDERFKSVHNDPRFRLPNLKNLRVKVDDRFSKKELAKLNSTATGKKVKIDRYGRKLKETDGENDLKKYYEHEEESDEETGSDSESESESEAVAGEEEKAEAKKLKDSDSSSEESESDEAPILDRARGEGLASSSDDSDDSGSDSSSDSESDEDLFEGESDIEIEDSKPPEGDPTSSFAVVNMDWDNLRAVDLMATFISFVPKTGSIKSVSIYPSEFGKEQLQREEIEGPPKDLFKSKKKKKEEDSDSESDDDLDLNNAEDLEKATRKLYEDDDGQEDYDSKALRRYQLQRLRYYYAVVKCDSVQTAKAIYDNCDGTEYESTANIFDLRYVPEDMDFEDDDVKDVCTKIPSSYKPNSTFVTDALQHSKVKLTWDETPKERQKFSSRQFSQKEIDEMDFKAYLASDSEGSDNEGAGDADKYKNLLGGSFSFSQKGQDEDEVDMEITFNPGLDTDKDAREEKEQKLKEEEESTIAAYKRKEKERRQRRMDKFKQEKRHEKEINEAIEAQANGKSSKKKNQPDDKKKAELELVMMDENEEPKADHFNMRDIIKSEKNKGKKSKKGKKNIDTELVQDNFEADLNDPRFNEIFEDHSYAIDPTSSEFKKTNTMKKIMDERSKRHRYDGSDSKKNKKHKKLEESGSLNALVSKLRRKSHN